MKTKSTIAILGAGNIGTAIALGLIDSDNFTADRITLTRRHPRHLESLAGKGFFTTSDNPEAVRRSDVVLVAVEPQQIDDLLDEIRPFVKPGTHTVISVVSGVTVQQIKARLVDGVDVVRAMPNTAIAIRESMTCLASTGASDGALDVAASIFATVGKTLVIDEEDMTSATALGACGVAFFLRAIRAASQGGVEIGFHYEDALAIAAQTAKGAASLLLSTDHHPEREIDKVTTPRGCTIAGLNQMEHEGFSSAMIKGITTSARKAGTLYEDE